MTKFRQLLALIPKSERWKFVTLGVLLTTAALFEAAGLALLAPYLAIIVGNPLDKIPFAGAIHLFLPVGVARTDIITVLSFVLLGFYAVRFCILSAAAYGQSRVTYDAQSDLSTRLVRHYFSLPYEQFIRRSSAEYTRNIVTAANQVYAGVVTSLLGMIAEASVISLLIVVMITVDPTTVGFAVLALGIVGALYTKLVWGPLRRYGRDQNDEVERFFAHVGNLFSGMKELKIARLETSFLKNVVATTKRYTRALCVGAFLNQLPRFVLETIFVGAIVLFVLTMVLLGRPLDTIIPPLTAFAAAGLRIAPALSRMAGYSANAQFYWPATDILYREMSQLSDNPPSRTVDTSTAPIWGKGKSIIFRDVNYSYPGTEKQVIAGLNLEIPYGSRVAFIGPTGSGKSTILDLLLGLITAQSGRITVGSQPLSSVREQWWSHVSYVPQSVFLLDSSVERNIAFDFTENTIDPKRLGQAIEASRLADFMEKARREGRDQRVGDKGLMLSGGERHRIGLARALYRGSDVIILDEATAALDGETERQITDLLFSFDRSKTLIFVAHRLSTIERCDTIFVLRDGKIERTGDFQSLHLGQPQSVAG